MIVISRIFRRNPGRWTALGPASGLLALAALAIAGAPRAVGQQAQLPAAQGNSATTDAAPVEPEPAERLREGSVLNKQTGIFKITGDRITFYPSERDESFRVLENLALERIWRMLDDTRGRAWSVTGKVTEYRGRNYLLIERAVVRSRTAEAAAP